MTFRIAHTPAHAVTIVVAARKAGAVSTWLVPKSSAFATPTSTSTARRLTATIFLSIRDHLLSLRLKRLHKRPGNQEPTDQTSTAHQEVMHRQIFGSHSGVAFLSPATSLAELSFTRARHRLKTPPTPPI